MPRTMTGFYNPPAQYAAGRGEDERPREGGETEETVQLTNWFTWVYALNGEESLEKETNMFEML